MNIERVVGQVLTIAIAAAFLAIGLRGIFGRRPLLLPGRWFVANLALIFLRPLIHLPGSASSLPDEDVISPFLPILMGGVLVVLWFQMRGYVVFGATEPLLRAALHSTLDARSMSHEDRPGAIHLPSEGLELRLQFNVPGGTAHIKVIPARGKPLLRDLVRDLKLYFVSHPVPHRERVFAIYTCIGALLVAVALLYLF